MNANLKARLDIILSHLEETMRPGAATVRELMDEHEAALDRAEKAEADLISIRASARHVIDDRDKLLSKASDDAFDESFEFAEMKTRVEEAEAENIKLRKTNHGMQHPPSIGGKFVDRSLEDLAHAAQVLIGDEQEKPNCDMALIAILGDTVRLTREAVPEIGLRKENIALKARAEKAEADNAALRGAVASTKRDAAESCGKLEVTETLRINAEAKNAAFDRQLEDLRMLITEYYAIPVQYRGRLQDNLWKILNRKKGEQ